MEKLMSIKTDKKDRHRVNRNRKDLRSYLFPSLLSFLVGLHVVLTFLYVFVFLVQTGMQQCSTSTLKD